MFYFIVRALKGLSQSLRGSTIISADGFHTFCRQNGHILAPATLLQSRLRNLVLGVQFWKRQTRNRVEISDGVYIPFTKLLKQITEGHRDRARRASLLELTFNLTQQMKHPHDDQSMEPTVEIESPPIFSCCLPLSPRKTHPELPPTESGPAPPSLMSLTDQQRNPPSENISDTESNLNHRASRSRSSVFEPEEPLDEDLEALLTKQLSQRYVTSLIYLLMTSSILGDREEGSQNFNHDQILPLITLMMIVLNLHDT